MKQAKIDLTRFLAPESKIFAGRDRGEDIRLKSEIDNLIRDNEELLIVIPQDIITISPSFMEEYFYNIVKELGKEIFFQRVKFENPGNYPIKSNLETAISRIMRRSNALKI